MADGKRIPLHDGGFVTWDEKGKTVEGIFAGMRNGQFGELAVLQTEKGKVALATPSVLKSALQGVQIGTKLQIIYKGEDASKKKGQSGLKRFEVYAIED